MTRDLRFVEDAEVRANGGVMIYRGALRVDDPYWPAEAARLGRGLRINDAADPDPKGWVALVFPDGSVRLSPRIAQGLWFRERAPED
jgi:hypothetical protein